MYLEYQLRPLLGKTPLYLREKVISSVVVIGCDHINVKGVALLAKKDSLKRRHL
jgi:hypothetical protein